MTKYVLNSGGLKNNPNRARMYFDELCKGMSSKTKVLWCFFATLPTPTKVRFEKYTNLFAEYFPESVSPQNFNATLENFVEEVRQADVVYLHGGEVVPLKEVLQQIDYQEVFRGKVIGCNSASSMVFSSSYWSCSNRTCGDGLGLFDIKYLAHYKSEYGSNDPRGPIDWEAAKAELTAYGNIEHEVVALEEGEFRVFEV